MKKQTMLLAGFFVAGITLGAVEPKLEPLPPGAIEPRGWLRDWCLAARDGYTGHMDEFDPEFVRAWTEKYAAERGNIYDWEKGAWSLEGGGYWFDGLVRLAYCLHDEGLIAQAHRRIDPAVSRAKPGNCLFLWWMKKTPESISKGGWTFWASGLFSRAVVGAYEATRDPKYLQALRTVYGSDTERLIQRTWAPDNAMAAYLTWRWTKDPAVAKELDALCDEEHSFLPNGVKQFLHAPSLQPGSAAINLHGVQTIESCTPWALMYLYTGRRQFLDAAAGWHERLNLISMQPNGVLAMDEAYQPTGGACGSETCDVANYLWSQLVMLAVTGEGKYADRAERAFFNAGAATVTRDFRRHVYHQAPNRLGDAGGQWSYQPTHGPLCCTAALNRIVPYFVTSMWMATPDGGYEAVAYGPAGLATDKIAVECKTDYPFGETLTFTVTPKQTAEIPLRFHVPAWCSGAALLLNSQPCGTAGQDGAFLVRRVWKAGDTLVLSFPMKPVFEQGVDRGSDIPLSLHNTPLPRVIPLPDDRNGEPYATVSCGPLLFALGIPEKDGNPNVMADGAKWRYALDSDNPGLRLSRGAMPQKWDWPFNAPVKVEVNAVEIPGWSPCLTHVQLPRRPVSCAASATRARLSLIPYGCAKLRLSMFPVASENAPKPVPQDGAAGVYDAAEALKANAARGDWTNPFTAANGGVWSYWKASALTGGKMEKLTTGATQNGCETVKGFGVNGLPFVAADTDEFPVFVPVAMGEGQRLLPGELILHPADDSLKYVIVRFTAPKTAFYSIRAKFRDLKANPIAEMKGSGLGVEAALVINNKELLKGIVSIDAGTENEDDASASQTFQTAPQKLDAGTTVDFVIGPDGSYGYDATALRAIVKECRE